MTDASARLAPRPAKGRAAPRLAGAVALVTAAALLPTGTATAGAYGGLPNLLPTASAEATRAAFAALPAFDAVPESLSLRAVPVLLHGTLRDVAGEPLAGAQVLLSAWPSTEAIRAMPVGSQVNLLPVARTVTDSAGRFELRSLLTPAMAAVRGANGLDVELDVFHGGRHSVQLSQVVHDAGTGGWARALPREITGAPKRPANPANLLDLTLDPARAQAVSRLGASAPANPGDHVVPPVGCSSYTKLHSKRAMSTVATAVARNGTTVKAVYTAAASTETSTGFSYDGGVSFGVSGARSRTATFSGDYHDQRAKKGKTISRAYQIEWVHHVLDRHCPTDHQGGYQVQVATSPHESTGGGDIKRRSRYPAWRCNPDNTAPGRGFKNVHTEDDRAATYSSAFSFVPTGKGGFSGATTSGYSKAVRITFAFGKGGGKWCGHSGFPISQGQRVQGFKP